VGIHLNLLEEGCCNALNILDTLDLDDYKQDKQMSSVDKVLECQDRYIFIEEKSFFLDWFRLCAKRKNIQFIPRNKIIEDEFLNQISTLSKEEKKELLYKSIFEKTLSLSDKIKDTTILLMQDDNFDNKKIKNTNTIYLYCKSNNLQLDRLIALTFNSKKQQNKIIECNNLNKYLTNKGCANNA
jgi:hypothetical protein